MPLINVRVSVSCDVRKRLYKKRAAEVSDDGNVIEDGSFRDPSVESMSQAGRPR